MIKSPKTEPSVSQSPVRRGRPPAGSSSLSREAIVLAAVDVIDKEGAAALSLRVVGRKLGVDAKSLYKYIESKEALLDAIAGHVLSRMVVPTTSGDLRTDIIAIAQAFRVAALSSHREAAILVLSRPIESLAHVMPLEATLAVLIGAGAEPGWAVHAVRATLAFISGSLLREASVGLTLGADDPATAGAREVALTKLDLPHIALVAKDLSHLDHDREFDFGIGVLAGAFVAKLKL